MTTFNEHVMENGKCINCRQTATSSGIMNPCPFAPPKFIRTPVIGWAESPVKFCPHPSHRMDGRGQCENCCQCDHENYIQYECPLPDLPPDMMLDSPLPGGKFYPVSETMVLRFIDILENVIKASPEVIAIAKKSHADMKAATLKRLNDEKEEKSRRTSNPWLS